jgi:hypothetical protein
MSIFLSNKHVYWDDNFHLVFHARELVYIQPISDTILNLLDYRAHSLLSCLQLLYRNVNQQIDRDSFGGLAIVENDLEVLAYLMNRYFQENSIPGKVALTKTAIILIV